MLHLLVVEYRYLLHIDKRPYAHDSHELCLLCVPILTMLYLIRKGKIKIYMAYRCHEYLKTSIKYPSASDFLCIFYFATYWLETIHHLAKRHRLSVVHLGDAIPHEVSVDQMRRNAIEGNCPHSPQSASLKHLTDFHKHFMNSISSLHLQ